MNILILKLLKKDIKNLIIVIIKDLKKRNNQKEKEKFLLNQRSTQSLLFDIFSNIYKNRLYYSY